MVIQLLLRWGSKELEGWGGQEDIIPLGMLARHTVVHSGECVGSSDVCKVCVPPSHGDALRTRWRLQQALQTLLLYGMGQWKSNFPSKRSWSEWTRKNLRQWFSAWHGESGELAEGSSFDVTITLKRSFSKYTAVLSANSRCVISKTRVPTVVKYNPLGCGDWPDVKNHLVRANMFCLR